MLFHGGVTITWDARLHKRGYDIHGDQKNAPVPINWQVHLGSALIIAIAVAALISATKFPSIGPFFTLVSLQLVVGLWTLLAAIFVYRGPVTKIT